MAGQNACFDCDTDSLPEYIPPTPSEVEASRRESDGDKDVFIVRMYRLPDNCTPHLIVQFFSSSDPVNVFLGVGGVIIQRYKCNNYAFVLFKGSEALNLAIQKNGSKMDETPIIVEPCTLFNAMFLGCGLRRKIDIADNNNRYIILQNLPITASHSNIMNLLYPYNIWVDTKGGHSVSSSMSNGKQESTYLLTSELAAFYVYMKKNRTIHTIHGVTRQIRVRLLSCYAPFDSEEEIPSTAPVSRPLVVKNIVRRQTFCQHSWAIVSLSNLPNSITANDIVNIFAERVMIPKKNISFVPFPPYNKTASIYFNSQQEGLLAVDNIRHFTIENHVVHVHICCFTEE